MELRESVEEWQFDALILSFLMRLVNLALNALTESRLQKLTLA
jgi:hypothetical protein